MFQASEARGWQSFPKELSPCAHRRSLHPAPLGDSSSPGLELHQGSGFALTQNQNVYEVTKGISTRVLNTLVASPE